MTLGSVASVPIGTLPIRVMVVENSERKRRLISAALEGDLGLTLVAWASDGAEAARAIPRVSPDIVILDLNNAPLGSVEAIRLIMTTCPVPIVVIATTGSAGDDATSRAALAAGVLAVVPWNYPEEVAGAGAKLRHLLKTMAQVKLVRRRSFDRALPDRIGASTEPTRARRETADVIAIGASTGGPQALHTILTLLPREFAVPILVVQHIAPGFSRNLVDWLGPVCPVPVHLAVNGMRLDEPGVYIGPTGLHLTVANRRVVLTSDPPFAHHRPSATVLFRSVARAYGDRTIGIILSGMGDDGAAGLRELKEAGGITFSQDETSSVVFGMPAAAIALGIVDQVLPPSGIAAALSAITRSDRELR